MAKFLADHDTSTVIITLRAGVTWRFVAGWAGGTCVEAYFGKKSRQISFQFHSKEDMGEK